MYVSRMVVPISLQAQAIQGQSAFRPMRYSLRTAVIAVVAVERVMMVLFVATNAVAISVHIPSIGRVCWRAVKVDLAHIMSRWKA